MANFPTRQRQRANFLIELLNTEEAKRVRNQLGIKSHGFLQRLQDNLAKHASIADAPRSGRGRKYTDELLDQARDQLMECEYYVWSKQHLVESLMADGILPAGTSIDGFWEAFVPHLQHQGLQLVYGRQRLTFAMSSQHARLRLSWCRQQQSVITASTVREYWFTDEITMEHGPHPGGESCLPVHVAALVPACLQPVMQASYVADLGMLALVCQPCICTCSPMPHSASQLCLAHTCTWLPLLPTGAVSNMQHHQQPCPHSFNQLSFHPLLCSKQVCTCPLAHPGQHATPSPALRAQPAQQVSQAVCVCEDGAPHHCGGPALLWLWHSRLACCGGHCQWGVWMERPALC